MKWILTLSLLASFSALAGHTKANGQPKEDKLQAAKAKYDKMFDTGIATLQKAKACVASAKDKEALKVCKSTLRDQMKSAYQAAK